ncbi:response regulator receiver modulated diguanylate cyclase [Abditibacterium utsteinense]|uniref:Response regulator receiver modulated diguanylate cyclase n=1 Tax=Abditibacterium utsteinense TaxID=1960156 RepID=A0A2S8SQS1_9BACT|nr:response regulator [Abditibacterium utsteinense]PQV63154.1 response regulator receiver modulated diguanylate cyclase [Abditibacterium utsteinense]
MAYILCVDDEDSISSLVRQILIMAGHEVEIADDGFSALSQIAAREPDLIVLDRSMPGMDGIDVCRSIKANPFLSRVPVLMLTALANIDFKVEGFDAGADDYLAKPFEPRELTARITALLRLVAREGDRNPSSGLPGGQAIAREIEGRVARNEACSVIYFDLDYFKPFADTFGFSVADEVISRTGALLGKLAAECGDFAGHIGGDDFLLVSPAGRAHDLAQSGAARFSEVVKRAVSAEIFARGVFHGLNRDGEAQEFPLARLTAVIIPVDPQNWVSVAHLGEAAATWKKAAKTRGAGSIIFAEN